MKLVPFEGELDPVPEGTALFDGELDEDEQNKSPFSKMAKESGDWVAGWPDAIGGLAQGAGTLVAGMPSMLLGGVRAAGSLLKDTPTMLKGGRPAVEAAYGKAGQLLDTTVEHNFGLGQFKPWTKQGEISAEQIGKIAEAPKNILGAGGEYVGGSGGRLAGEIAGDLLANFVSPTAAYMATKAGMKKFTSKKPEEIGKPQTTAEKIRAEAAAKEAEVTPPEVPEINPAERVMDNIQSQLGFKEGEASSLQPWDAPMTQVADTLMRRGDIERADNAQATIDRRNEFMQDEIKQRTALEQQAAERARQEQAPVVSPEQAKYAEEQRMVAEAKQAEVTRIEQQQRALQQEQRDLDAAELMKHKREQAQRDLDKRQAQLEQDVRVQRLRDEEARIRSMLGERATPDQLRSQEMLAQANRPQVLPDPNNPARGVDTTSPEVLKRLQQEELFTNRPQTDEMVRERRKQESDRAMMEARLVEIEQELRDTSYRPIGNQQGPKTRAAQRKQKEKSPFNNTIIELNSGLKPNWKKLFPTKVENVLLASDDGTYIPNNPDTKVAIEKALEQGKDGKQWTYVQSGSTSTAMKSGSPIIKAASEVIQNAVKRADLLIRNSIFPAEQRLKNLSRDDITTLAEVFKDEMKLGKRYDGDILANNLSVKQIEAYTEMRKMFDDALDAQNAARLAKGQDPVKPMEAYMASRWKGDFRRPIYEKTKDGQKLVWYLADNTRGGLEKQTKALLKDFPDLIVEPKKDHIVRSSTSKTELDSMYTKMLDILGRDDPAIQKIQQAIADQEMIRGAGALSQEKHFEKKAGIRGFVGDRPGANPRQEAVDMFQQQIQYAKNAYKWSELQKAADDIKAITSDPRLQEQQPNNIKYIREYFKNAVGMGESAVTRAVNDAVREGMGVSPALIDNAVGNVKSFFILQKLAASAGYTVANLVQTSNVLPYLAQMAGAGYRGNPVSSVLAGSLQGMAMASWHYARMLDSKVTMDLPNQFMKDAFAYAEDNGVIARSVYDESPVESSFSLVGRGANLAGKTMTVPESFVRSVAFMTYANMLKSSGKFTDNSKLFQMAEEYVNKSLVDYRESERPMMFAKAGSAGNFANTLQTYPISFYNQYSYMAKQAMEGNPWGLGTMLAVHYGVAGLMGLPGFDDADQVYKWLRDNALPTDMWADVMKSPFMSDPKLWLMENAGKSAVYGALSENTGLGLTSRIQAPGAGAMLQSPAGPITDIGKQALNLGKAVVDPTDKSKWAQVGMSSLPVGLQGLFETTDFMKDYTFVERPDGKRVFMKTTDIADRKGGYARTPEEVQMRKFGLRSQKEVVERDVSYATSSALQTQAKKSGELIDRFYSAVRQGNKAEAQKLNRLYIQLTGREDGIRDMDIENQIKEEFMTDVERSNSAINTINKAKAVARMNAILEKR